MLDLADDVVAEVAHQPAVQRRKLGQVRRSPSGEHRVEGIEDAALERDARGQRACGRDCLPPGGQCGHRVAADERPAPPALAVLDRLEEEAGVVANEPSEGSDRRGEVGQQLPPDRDDGVVARQRTKLSARGA